MQLIQHFIIQLPSKLKSKQIIRWIRLLLTEIFRTPSGTAIPGDRHGGPARSTDKGRNPAGKSSGEVSAVTGSVRQQEREEVRAARDERACERVKHARIEKLLTRLGFRSCRVCVCVTACLQI